jgi:Tfp pilus assembly PilM family ATPase
MKILAFDIGSFSIKAVELDVTFGRFELTDYFIEKVTETVPVVEEEYVPGKEKEKPKEKEDPNIRRVVTAGQVEAIRRILNARPFRYDRMSVNLPKGWVSTRLFQLPTKDRKAIQNSIQFELEDDLPFSTDDSINDFAILKNRRQLFCCAFGCGIKNRYFRVGFLNYKCTPLILTW